MCVYRNRGCIYRRPAEDDVRVRTREAEGADADRVTVEGRGGHRDTHRRRRPVHAVIGSRAVQRCGYTIVLEHQRRLDQAGEARRRLQVPHVGLDRPHRQWTVALAKHRGEGPDLDRITQRGAGAVSFDVPDAVRRQAGGGERAPDHRLWGWTVRRGESAAAPVVIHGGAEHEGVDRITAFEGVGQPNQSDRPAALAAGVAIGGIIEGLTPPIGSEGADLREIHRALGGEHQVHAGGQREVALIGA